MSGLVGRAGPALFAAELAVGLHHPPRHAARRLLKADARTPHQVERTDVQRGPHCDPGPTFDQLFGKQRAGIAMIQRTVDMGRRDRNEPRSAEQARTFHDDAHGHRGAGAPRTGRDLAFFAGQSEAHAAL
jgi:hypothetical protein